MNGNTKFFASIALALLAEAAGVVWWASHQSSKIRHNDFQIQMMARDVEKTTEFVELWPAGRWGSGSLPSDVRQDLKIEQLEAAVKQLSDRLYSADSDPTQ